MGEVGGGGAISSSTIARAGGPAPGPRRTRHRHAASAFSALVLGIGCAGAAQAATKLQVLLSFGGGRGMYPIAAPVTDSAGNLYVTSANGGAYGYGAVVELSPPAPGQKAWTRTVIHAFDLGDGAYPAANLIMDGAGDLYGVTAAGGSMGDGVAFELSAPAGHRRGWRETLLHGFDGADGQGPSSALIPDGAGDFYGTASAGGAHGDGVVYELSPPVARRRAWVVTVLYSFGGDGQAPGPGPTLLSDGRGDLYGTTSEGGAHGVGVAYRLSPPSPGRPVWTLKVLHSFDEIYRVGTNSPMIMDGAGNLYGTSFGGAEGDGQVYELSPPARGETRWTWTVLRTFDGERGKYPMGGLIADAGGNLYGMTNQGGAYDYGVLFELSPSDPGRKHWNETVLHAFDGTHGRNPESGLIADGAGGFYGTLRFGGNHDDGVVFKIAP